MYILKYNKQIELTILLQYMDSSVIERKDLNHHIDTRSCASRKLTYFDRLGALHRFAAFARR